MRTDGETTTIATLTADAQRRRFQKSRQLDPDPFVG
jgi:hypothetical protein